MKKFIVSALAFTPMFVFAQGNLSNVGTLLDGLKRLVGVATPLVMGIALLGFFWGLAMYIFNSADEDKRKEGKHIMLWGIIALFVMVAVWGLVGFISTALLGNTTTGGTVNVPGVSGVPLQ
ncbi:MAG: hypothetical protein ACYC1K_01795 [Minisyncoccota bacterium]